jgi:hypothetical protein
MKAGYFLTGLLLLLLLGNVLPLRAQDYPRQPLDFDFLIQELFPQPEDDQTRYEDIYETLFQYFQHPLDLNRATREELHAIFLLSGPQITSLLTHRERHGPLLTIYELQAVPGFDLLTIYKILPFVRVADAGLQTDRRPLLERIIGEDNNALLLRYGRVLQEQVGYTPPDTLAGGRLSNRYLGSPYRLFARYRISHPRDFSLGITAEKDPGEPIAWDPATRRYGMDFYSAHFQLYNRGRFRSIAIGDYQLQFGQGLLLSSGFAIGKGAETITTLRRSNLGVRPYASVLEMAFFRGGAVTYRLTERVDVTGFYSAKRVSANLQTEADTLLEMTDYFTGIQASGFHRTPTELANRLAVQERIYGGNATFRSRDRNLTLGATWLQTSYGAEVRRRPLPYRAFEFAGTHNATAGFFYSYNWQNVNFFGESGRSGSGGMGTVNGLVASLTERVDVAFLYRNYGRNFHTFYGNAFGEGSRTINERGFYTGLKIRPRDKWEITAYYDRFRFPWLRFRVDAPSEGQEYLVRVLYRPSRQASLYGQFRTESKGRNDPHVLHPLDVVTQAVRRNYLLFYDFSPTPVLNLRSRVQFSSFAQTGPRTSGYLIAQDLNLRFQHVRLSARYALFDTDDFDNRQYVFEKDVLYAFSIPAFSGQGTRFYLLTQFRPTRAIDLWLRYAHTTFRDRRTVGSGLELIPGPQRSEVRVQVRYKF